MSEFRGRQAEVGAEFIPARASTQLEIRNPLNRRYLIANSQMPNASMPVFDL